MSRLVALLAVILLALPLRAQSPAPAAGSAPLKVQFQQFQLPNGLTVILHQDKTVPVATVNIWYHVGSANEKPGRTGFAHLFEHLMFEGSKHVKEGQFDTLLESAGAVNNASTANDRTNYFIDVPINALDLALYLDSDRMGFLLDAMPPEQVNSQRDVVKNERRQSYENRPYGMASIKIDEMLWPDMHPYHWPVIGYMQDLTAASQADVVEFFKKYYSPANASLVVAGDIDYDKARAMVEKWFSDVPAGKPVERVKAPAASLDAVKRATLTDKVSLPRLYLAWITPALYAPGDAALDVVSTVLTGGKNSRLYKRLVYDTQIAQDVSAYQASAALGSSFQIVATARPGHSAAEMQKMIDEELEKLRASPPELREVQRAINQTEAAFYRRMERVSSKADQLNAYLFAGKSPDWFAQDLARYTSLTPADAQAAIVRYLPAGQRVELIVEPEGKR
jgi:zinc protease